MVFVFVRQPVALESTLSHVFRGTGCVFFFFLFFSPSALPLLWCYPASPGGPCLPWWTGLPNLRGGEKEEPKSLINRRSRRLRQRSRRRQPEGNRHQHVWMVRAHAATTTRGEPAWRGPTHSRNTAAMRADSHLDEHWLESYMPTCPSAHGAWELWDGHASLPRDSCSFLGIGQQHQPLRGGESRYKPTAVLRPHTRLPGGVRRRCNISHDSPAVRQSQW